MAAAGKPEKLSLRVGVVGLGQAGGNLAAEFHRRGYKALAINTAQTDLRALAVPEGLAEDARLYIGVEGSDGAGKDPEYGRACVEQHAERIREEVTSRFEGVDLLLLCAGLGGGTGSCVAELWTQLQPTGIPLAALVTLPAGHESGIAKVNAVRAADRLVDAPLNARLLVDNARVSQKFHDLDLMSFYKDANAAIAEPLDAFNRLGARTDIRSLRSFDGEDFRKVLLSGGVMVPTVTTLPARALSADELEKAVLGGIDGGQLFAKGISPGKIALIAVVLVAPEDVLREMRASAIDEMEGRLKQKTGGGAVYTGLYVGKASELTLMVLAASNSLPSSVEELLSAARKEGGVLSQKIHEDLPRLDTSSLAGMSLSRAPAPPRLSKPPSAAGTSSPPRPRPVQSQIPAPAPAASAAPSPAPGSKPPVVEDAPPAANTGKVSPPAPPASRPAAPARVSDDETGAAPPPGPVPKAPPPSKDAFKEPVFTEPGAVQVTDPEAATFQRPRSMAGVHQAAPKSQPTQVLSPEELEASLSEDNSQKSAEDLQKFYDDLVERFRGAPDRKTRERVARRLMEDARSSDEDIRALAVWAMVAINDRGFRRALTNATRDAADQVRQLAQEGLNRLGGEDGSD